MKTKDPDARAIAAACKALEQSSTTRMLYANLHFLWDRYIVHPPAKGWWSDPLAKNPKGREASRE